MFLIVDSNEDADTAIANINLAIETINTKTCVQLVERTDESDYLYITPLTGCWSYMGNDPSFGEQTVSIGRGCTKKATVIHELMHALGFLHEHARPDRDTFVEIIEENIDSRKY